MQPLELLVAAAATEAELAWQLQICNARRYCEGRCVMFAAMAPRFEIPSADLHHLANLRHRCGACLHACQYAPPHEFAVALPPALLLAGAGGCWRVLTQGSAGALLRARVSGSSGRWSRSRCSRSASA